jgi:hypothetical protein
MIPFALLGLRAWRTIFSAGVTTVVLLVVPTMIYGLEYWPLLQLSLTELSDRVLYHVDKIELMHNPAFFLTFIGMGKDLAWAVQWGISAASAVAVFALWRSDRAGFEVKAAGLHCAILLSASYFWYYESAILVAVALFALRGGVLAVRPLHLLLLVPLWVGGALQALNYFVDAGDSRWLGGAYISPVVFICFALCLRSLLPQSSVARTA